MLAQFLLSPDEIAAVHANAVLDHRCHDVGTQTLTVRNDRVLSLLREVMDQVHAIEDTL